MIIKNKKYNSKSIEKKHPSPKKPQNPMCPPKENLNGTSRFSKCSTNRIQTGY